MYIDKLEVGFTNMINIGRCAYFVYCDKSGVFITIEEIFEKCQSFHKVVIAGDEPLLQKEEIAKLCKKLVKVNPRINIEIFTTGNIKPAEITGYINNTVFNVLVPPKNNIRYKVDSLLFIWYSEVGSNFIFETASVEDIDNAITLMNTIGIKKSQSFINPISDVKNLNRQVMFYGINLAPKVEWSDENDEYTN